MSKGGTGDIIAKIKEAFEAAGIKGVIVKEVNGRIVIEVSAFIYKV